MDYSKIAELDMITIYDCYALYNEGYHLEINDGKIINLILEEEK